MARSAPARRRPPGPPPGTDAATIRVVTAEAGQRLDHVLADRLPTAVGRPLSRSAVRQLIIAGAVARNGRPARQPATSLRAGDRLRVVVHWDRLRTRGQFPATRAPTPAEVGPALDGAAILYLDDWLVIVDKPPGLPTHATLDPRRPHLVLMASELLARLGAAGSEPATLGVHHRLDRDTSGPVLFTLDSSVNASVGALFAEHRVEKFYWALCTSATGDEPPEAWEVQDHLGVVDRAGRRARYGPVRAGGKRAHSRFRRQRRLDDGSWLIEGWPLTGRTHQLRVHLAEAGLPIVGDDLYGGRRHSRVLLHCRELALPHPVTGAELRVRADPPADWPVPGGRR